MNQGMDLLLKPNLNLRSQDSEKQKSLANREQSEDLFSSKFNERIKKEAKQTSRPEVQKSKSDQYHKSSNQASERPQAAQAHSNNPAPHEAESTYNLSPTREEIEELEVSSAQSPSLANQTNTAPMLEFVESLDTQFGVPPQQILSAMSNVEGQEILLTPDNGASEFVKNLPLNSIEKNQVSKMYQQMMKESGLLNQVKTKVQTQETFQPQDLGMKFVEPSELNPKEKLNLNLDRMNQNFFDVYPQSRFGRSPEQLQQINQNTNLQHQNKEFFEPTTLPKQDMNLANTESNFFDNELSVSPVVTSAASISAAKPLVSDTSSAPMTTNAYESLNIDNNPSAVDLSQFSGNSESFSFDQQAQTDDFITSSSPGDEMFSLDQVESQMSEIDGMIPQHTAQGREAESAPKVGATASATNLQNSTENTEPITVREAIQRVESLSQKGGGEMKIQLNPEGLGEMQVRVSVNEGKVDVQMLTNNKEARELLSGEMNSLKASLAEQNLELKDIRVDTKLDLGRQLEEQLADQQREQARAFLRDFREGNFFNRRNIGFNSAVTGYQEERERLNPGQLLDKTNNKKNTQRRLDVVA